jgi:ABC-type polysaccharide/polyol phosphate export permease
MLVVLMTFGFRVLPLAMVIPFTSYSLSVATLWLVPSFVLGGLSAIAIGLVLAVLFARFRDLSPMINLVLRLAFFASPVFWHLDSVSQPEYLELFRNPILGLVPSTYCTLFVVVSTILLCGTSSVLLSHYHKRIPYLIS